MRHTDFAVLGQFWAKIFSVFTHVQNAPVKLKRRYQMDILIIRKS